MKETGTIFDLYEPEIREGLEGYMDLAKNAPEPKDDSFLNTVSEYAKTFIKGSIQGISKLGQMMGPTYDLPKFENGKLKPGKSKEEQLEEQELLLEELLPTEESYGKNVLQRGLKEAPSMMAFPGSALQSGARTLIGSGAAETLKELGAPEWAETAAELTAFIGPDITKKLISSGKNKEIIDAARKFGLTDEQITPLIQSEFKQKWLSKLSPKRGSTQKALKNTKEALGEAYTSIQKGEKSAIEISEKANGTLINDLFNTLNEMPREVQGKIEKDLQDLLSNKITGQSLMNFYKDVNYHLSGNTKQLSLLKEPIKKAIGTISPDLAEDFDMINKLFSKYYPIAERLKPNLVSDLISAGEALGLMGSLTMGYAPSLVAIVGEKAGKKLAQQMLINPRLQQLSKKMVHAINDNKYRTVKKLTEAFSRQIKESSPEASKILDTLSEEEIIEFLSHQNIQ